MEKLLLTIEEAGEVLGVSRSTVFDLVRMRLLRSVKIGRVVVCRCRLATSSSTACWSARRREHPSASHPR